MGLQSVNCHALELHHTRFWLLDQNKTAHIKKRDSTIENPSPILGFHHWLKVVPLYHDWLRSLN